MEDLPFDIVEPVTKQKIHSAALSVKADTQAESVRLHLMANMSHD